MVRKLIETALHNPFVVILLALALAGIGIYSFINVNVEAYPDPAPAIVEVVAQFPGASAEEVERQVTIPLEITFAGMPGLKTIRSQSLYGLCDIKMNWNYGPQYTYEACRQEVINRLATITQPLPAGVNPTISPESPTGEIYRYILKVPKRADGRSIYALNDIKALQDWVLEREFRTVQRIVDVVSFGGTVRRYEVQPDPDSLRRYGVTLPQLQTAITNSNATVGGDYVSQGHVAMTLRSMGLFGGGMDPVYKVLGYLNQEAESYLDRAGLSEAEQERLRIGLARREPRPPLSKQERENIEIIDQRAASRAATVLRQEEQRRIRDIRSLVIASVNSYPVRVEDVVEGGRLYYSGPDLASARAASGTTAQTYYDRSEQGVVVSHLTRQGRVGHWKADQPRPSGSRYSIADVGHDEDDVVECIVLLRKNEETLPALKDVKAKVEELNDPASGRLLPGVQIEPFYDRADLLHVTTETVTENLFVGITLVVLILFMFLSNVRTAVIVALNIPLALLFAFSLLFLRGRSANLLSIGAVDFGIIVDSSVIMVENIYRHLASGEYAELALRERILRASHEIERPLLFSTLIMVCAFIPLFTMSGPEGQLFKPMADTYAFALVGALVLATTLTPALCLYFLKNLKPVGENLFVRFLKSRYLWQLQVCLKYRWMTIFVMFMLILGTLFMLPRLGREFMPELEEGNLWIRGTAPLNITLEREVEISRQARAIIASYPEVDSIVAQLGRPDDGTDPAGFYNSEYFVPLRAEKDWPLSIPQYGWRSWLWGSERPRTKAEVIKTMNEELEQKIPGVIWNFSQNIRDNVMEALSGVKGENSVKIFGPDLDRLETLATRVRNILDDIPGIENVGIFHIRGQSHLEFRVDPQKCEKFGVQPADVNNVVQSALGAQPQTSMIEGEKRFDIAIRWPKPLRSSETSILDIPVDIVNNQVVLPQYPGLIPTAAGHGYAPPDPAGTKARTDNPISQQAPRLRLRDLVTPVSEDGSPDPDGQFERAGASDIYREDSKRMIAIKFSARGRDLGSAVAEARARTKDIFKSPYRSVWSGEFEEMEDAERRLMIIVPLSLGLIFILLFMAFHSLLDTLVVLSNVIDLSMGGIWALMLTGTNFSISAAVGFVSLFGVAIMDGLLMVSSFNAHRAHGLPLHESIMEGAAKRVRPVMMTALTAILGLLPAALSTKIGSQTQRPLAIVVVGGMVTTLFLTRYLMPVLYSFYGHREPPEGSGSMAH